jgi:hypothetical protein
VRRCTRAELWQFTSRTSDRARRPDGIATSAFWPHE